MYGAGNPDISEYFFTGLNVGGALIEKSEIKKNTDIASYFAKISAIYFI